MQYVYSRVWFPGGAAAADKIVDVYLIAGQSNAVGYGYDDLEENGFTDERLKNGYDNVLFTVVTNRIKKFRRGSPR